MGFDLNDPNTKYKEQALFHMNGPFNDPDGYKGRKSKKKQKDQKMKYGTVLLSVVAIPVVFMVILSFLHEPVHLVQNETAHDPTWDELMTFLKKDDTDRQQYQDGVFDCTQFAERLYNNAEQAGIRAAFVTIFWCNNSTGHALNAFQTTDKGLTFVDCTGSKDKLEGRQSRDDIVYVEEGKTYGSISIYRASDSDYDSFVRYKENKDATGFYEDPRIVEDLDIYWDYGLDENIGYRLHQRKEAGFPMPKAIVTFSDYIRNLKPLDYIPEGFNFTNLKSSVLRTFQSGV
ncbi:hypothetical protein [uncultured Methanomethylovorans sp.]|uniref:hypothetical protein n=1 Tax=uncultured Methanomethylovorans sp. TaxID=183759 RepID=UPI002AA8ED01|nr:hypothetical protein [uncultured Methanomethylovorans sp.]